jgi:hypothetical protein
MPSSSFLCFQAPFIALVSALPQVSPIAYPAGTTTPWCRSLSSSLQYPCLFAVPSQDVTHQLFSTAAKAGNCIHLTKSRCFKTGWQISLQNGSDICYSMLCASYAILSSELPDCFTEVNPFCNSPFKTLSL